MKLKSFSILCLGISLLFLASCIKNDDYQGPNASFSGRVIEDGTDNNVQTCTGNFTIRLEQLNWSSTPSPQDIPVKYDGTYQNTKLFSGHYRVSIHGGAFWPLPAEEMDIAQGTKHDFKLTPYLNINNFTVVMTDSVTMKLNFTMDAPVSGIPKILELQPFINTTQIVGPGASIFDFSDLNKVSVGKEWSSFSATDKSREIIIKGLVPGRVYYARVGARFDNNDKSYNLSNVIKIDARK